MTPVIRYLFVIGLVFATSAIEFVGNGVTRSLGLGFDAMHLLGDAAPLLLGLESLLAHRRKEDVATRERRITLVNIQTLLAVAALMFGMSVQRLYDATQVSTSMLYFALAGTAGNGAQLYFGRKLLGVHSHSHTGWGQVVHLAIDFGASVSVLLGAILLWSVGWQYADLLAAATVLCASVTGAWLLWRELQQYHRAAHHQ